MCPLESAKVNVHDRLGGDAPVTLAYAVNVTSVAEFEAGKKSICV